MQKDTDIFEKLNNHHLSIDESYWAEMEKRLLSDRQKAVPLWVWLTGTGIAASLVLLLIVRIFNADNENISKQMTQIERISTDVNCPEKTQITQIHANNIENKQVVETRQTTRSVQITTKKETPATPSLLFLNEATETPVPDTSPAKQYDLSPKYNNALIVQSEPQKRKPPQKKSWQIAAFFGAANSSAQNSSNYNNLAYLYDHYASDKTENNSGILNNNPGDSDRGSNSVVYRPESNSDKSTALDASPSEPNTPSIDEIFQTFAEATHLPPLSFGLTVRKNFNEYLAIETGLTYSFLQSKFKENNEQMHRNATLKLHYVGVPLNVVAYVLNKPQWNIYFSLGGMVEKGIMLDYVQHTTYSYSYYYGESSPIYTISLQDDISGWQWSFNTSVGVGYKFYRDISIYFEPRVMYYFKNNQPVSVRTEMPLIVGLNAGLRFEF